MAYERSKNGGDVAGPPNLDQTVFRLTEVQFEAFLRLLDGPPPPSEELIRLMATKSPWDEGPRPRR